MLEKHFKSQQYYTNEFYHACVNGDFELAVCLLKMGVNLNVKFEHGQNLLHIACMKNFYGLVQLLIKFGCNEFLKDNYGRTALHYAALNNSTAIVRYLVEKNTFSNNNNTDLLTKEFLNCQDTDGKTAIHLASENNSKEPIMIILSSGLADLHLEDLVHRSALTVAYTKKHWEIFELLVKSGSHISHFVLKDICVQGNMRALNILLRYFDSKSLASIIDFTQVESKRNSYLYLAIKYSHNLDFVVKLFQIGLKINSKDLKDFYGQLKHHVKAMDSAMFSYNLECFILMIKHKCFDKRLVALPNILTMFNACQESTDINFDQASNILNHCILLFLGLIFENFQILHNVCKKEDLDSLRLRMLYLFALAIYSSQLDVSKKFVQKWFERKFSLATWARPMAEQSSAKKHILDIYKESVDSPWSLQMLCRTRIKNEFSNIDYVLNDKKLIDALKIPSICVRYLKYEFI
ncbi:ankyrin repeat [Brachionus plicatilis]|uniref:Ankyrin repeat n=1 Tax=Brachionus plicatilis TaxID=10195 RepID=A0A3M7RU25_BRAPC|nr:ankyrin repeat [Brachionus plicatilis]